MKIDTAVQPTKTLLVKNPIDSSITSVNPGSTAFVSFISSSTILVRFPIECELYFIQMSPDKFIKSFKFITNKIEGSPITHFDLRD